MLDGLDIASSGRGIDRRLCAAFWICRHVDSKDTGRLVRRAEDEKQKAR